MQGLVWAFSIHQSPVRGQATLRLALNADHCFLSAKWISKSWIPTIAIENAEMGFLSWNKLHSKQYQNTILPALTMTSPSSWCNVNTHSIETIQ